MVSAKDLAAYQVLGETSRDSNPCHMYYNYSITDPLTTKNISFQSLYLIESKPYFLVEVSRMTFVEDSNR